MKTFIALLLLLLTGCGAVVEPWGFDYKRNRHHVQVPPDCPPDEVRPV